ncbi:hypothetical protein [Actinoplanes derwentensis]|uniref:Uncharacterized protein n=1 Tax=Actinoplanes derwentensis TaxID=113562 RepID=A0A1H2D7E6_9ACTN|nr:hypothetical protein [Actinoplanes derwentensis]GID90332.1 hypothetical protein Ade03nite_92560 [Actinoplanes derwentensis]SDT78392.1 hypothetical protein SAMN04489716_8352 [Actinoplanes derwentensis]
MDDALAAYAAGHADGSAGLRSLVHSADPATGPDYKVGVADGRIVAFQAELLAEVRRLMESS